MLRHDILNILTNNSIKRSLPNELYGQNTRLLPLKKLFYHGGIFALVTFVLMTLQGCTETSQSSQDQSSIVTNKLDDLGLKAENKSLMKGSNTVSSTGNDLGLVSRSKKDMELSKDDKQANTQDVKSQPVSKEQTSTEKTSKKNLDQVTHEKNTKQALDQKSVSKKKKGTKKKKVTKKKTKKPGKCKRGIHKGRKKCKIEKGHISVYHINRKKRYRKLRIIDDKNRIVPETRKILLELLGDWRTKKSCKVGYSFNLEYKGRASWRMYDCYVQDRLLWYLYLVGHHFDSSIHIVSGLRSNERKTSRHHNGHAVDFTVPGVRAKEVWEYCKRALPLVGIGYYPKGNFIHLDVGRDHHQAYWVDSSGSGEDAKYKSGVSQVQRGRAKKSQSKMISSIKRSLQKHHKRFKKKQGAYNKRKKAREKRRKARKKRKRSRKKTTKKKKKTTKKKKKTTKKKKKTTKKKK